MSTYYARRSRVPSRRALADRQLLAKIEGARSGRRCAYGARKTWKEPRRREVKVGRDQVARVMCEHGLVGKLRGQKKRATIPDEQPPIVGWQLQRHMRPRCGSSPSGPEMTRCP